MKSILKLIILLLLFGCKNSNGQLSFNSIDYSSCWGFDNSIKILNTGEVYIYYKDFQGNTFYYSLALKKTQLDSLSNIIAKLYTIKIDSIYMLERDSGRDFSLIIKSDKSHIITTYSGPYSGVKELTPLFNFLDYLIRISENCRKSAKSNFVFESKNKLKRILPPPPDINK
jgi:hypothetical protein